MSDINNFDVLKEMSKRNGDITMFPTGNMKSANSGKDGWGSVTFAVDNATVSRILKDEPLALCLFVYDIDKFKALKREMGGDE